MYYLLISFFFVIHKDFLSDIFIMNFFVYIFFSIFTKYFSFILSSFCFIHKTFYFLLLDKNAFSY